MKRTAHLALGALTLAAAHLASGQMARTPGVDPQPTLDLAATFVAERSLETNSGQNFWTQGGSVEFGANLWHGLGPAATLTGTHASSIASGNIPLSVVAVTFGPRYRFLPHHRVSAYGEGLFGVAKGFDSQFPVSASTSVPSASSLAIHLGGGIDYPLGFRFSLRLLDAAWIHTRLPNATGNHQDTLHLGAGFVYHLP